MLKNVVEKLLYRRKLLLKKHGRIYQSDVSQQCCIDARHGCLRGNEMAILRTKKNGRAVCGVN